MYCLWSSYESSRSLPRITLACFSVFPLTCEKVSLRTWSCCPRGHIRVRTLLPGKQLPAEPCCDRGLNPQGPWDRMNHCFGSADLGQPWPLCRELEAVTIKSLIVNKGDSVSPFQCFLFRYPRISVLLKSKELEKDLARLGLYPCICCYC